MRFSAAEAAERLLPGRFAALARPWASRFDALVSAPDARGQAGRMSLIAFGMRIVNAVIAFVSQVLLARYMGGFEYGIFVLVWVTMIILGNTACLGFQTSVIRFVPEYEAKDRPAELRGILVASQRIVFLSATALALAGALGIWLFEEEIQSYYVLPFYLGLICLPMIALGDLLQGTARAHGWPLWSMTPSFFIRPMLILVFLWTLHMAGSQPDAAAAVLAAIFATYLTTLLQIAYVARGTESPHRPVKPAFRLREWLIVSLPIFLSNGFYYLLTNADVLLVGRFMQPTDVAVYFATTKALALVHFVYYAVRTGVIQRYSAYLHSGDRAALARFARETTYWTFIPATIMGLAVLALGKPILMLFGPGFDAGYPLLFLLVAAVIFRATVGPAESLLTMSGHENSSVVVYAITLAVNIGLSVFLIPRLGLWGVAIGMSTALVVEAVLLAFTVRRKLGIVMVAFLPSPKETV
ncbi:lipopolysaccharide biosynthesis protein [Chelativorans sp. AA-79]|uniref:lipopolysaccharide biosynthesis protein n=1 Tax=Chelativorans sp. AA-79 TaxID=3028735 RepID=UPI0023FA23A5|nr:lipopolysaccharide biosynthesis protein [Chelativorans sp. AA-79]WEX09021.1 lipopolysaccharide biosynthesis protein [Chelativorans sp. AA-79]